jgi:two-component system, response regulator YesN
LTVLIVDDEVTVREGLQVLIDWAEYGFDAILESVDGIDALDKMVTLKPELTLLDIKMPRMIGTEAADRARKAGYTGTIIILSGYSDFAYAQNALRFDACAYLLKPVDEDELVALLREMREKPIPAREHQLQETVGIKPEGVVPEMLRIMESDFPADITLEAMAAQLGYNSAYLGKVFLGRTGESFNARLDKIRIRNAKALLSDSTLKVYEICERVGYHSLDYFYKKFKSHMGMSPSEYRKSAGIQEL